MNSLSVDRAILLSAIAVGFSYVWGHHVAGGMALVAWKGAGVALLAVWAVWHARSTEGQLFGAVMAFGAAGDVLIEVAGLTAGALAFLAGHIAAIMLYTRNARPQPVLLSRDRLVAAGVMVAVPVVAATLPSDRGLAPGIALYALGLAAMAGTAWLSRFPRHYVALGAALFVVSDLLIFARLGPLRTSVVPDLLVWPLYFGGQALIAWGAVPCLRRGAGTV